MQHKERNVLEHLPERDRDTGHQPQRQELELRGDAPTLDRCREHEAQARFRKVEGYRRLARLATAIERDLTDRRNKELAITHNV
ncbi:MAG TPA: hypothetical protein VMU39_03950 [Solirubrobacteraceae bacterium]|nr:hypothetical protein [Solirubrobacteraceae bacterium]